MNSKTQYGKNHSVMIPIPTRVKNTAIKAFELRDLGFKGATEIGWKRAHQLATRYYISIQDARVMKDWFARHVKASRPTYEAWIQAGKPLSSSWYNRRGIIAWLTWGGDAGYNWIQSQRVLGLIESSSR